MINSHFYRWVLPAASALLVWGCGKKAPQDQEGEWPAVAVVAKATQEVVDNKVVLVATLAARDEITIISELDAKVEKMPFTEGEPVKKKALLFKLDDTRTKAQLDEAESSFRLAELTYQRNTELLKSKTISQQELDRSEAEFFNAKAALALAKDEQAKANIVAPFAGIMGEREVSVGQYVTRGQVLSRLIQLDPLEVVFNVPERHVALLKNGMRVHFTARAFPGETFEGQVSYVAPMVDERMRSVRVKAELPNSDSRLKPGMFGQLGLVLERREQAVVIPEACIQVSQGASLVVTVGQDGRSAFTPVEVGLRFEGRAEIISGLAAGDWVVVEGFQKMGPGMMVIASPESEAYGVTPGPLGTPQDTPAQDEVSDAAH